MSGGVSVTLKIATSLDGRIALKDGTSQWITGAQSRARVHQMRAAHDAVIVGVGTVLADDPMLTARTVPLPKVQPARIVIDSRGRTPLDGRLVRSASLGRVIIATDVERSASLQDAGAELWPCGPGDTGGVDLEYFVKRCAVERLERLFLEGGGKLAASFVRAGLVDRIEWFRAPVLIGGDGISALGALGLTEMGRAPRWRMVATERIAEDVLETYEPAR
jgi:diaminohydroxyphosphoribosylaminopyrimidine deaminase/5-amino-6-(5-phosphoribosylamino)uracil reductase